MNNQLIQLSAMIVILSACTPLPSTHNGTYEPYTYNDKQYYPEDYNTETNYRFSSETSQRQAELPDSYYVGNYHSPTPHHDMDKTWVNQQSPQSYTIEVANDQKAASVATKLYKLPKTERMAEVKSVHQGETYYKGVYGNYNSLEEAQHALKGLPEEVRQGASIKQWSSIQETVTE